MRRPPSHKVRETLIGALVVAFVVSPPFIHDYSYGSDYTNHPWLIWNQGLAIANTGHPTLWLHATGTLGIFQPLYGFYGGSLYAIVGGVSALLGQRPEAAFVLSIVLFVAMAYRGVWLIGVQAGISRLQAHVPAFIFVTSAYYITDIYARGAWTEFAAVSGAITALAYGLLLARERWTAGRIACFAFAVIIFTGGHNITLVWGTVVLVIIGGAAWCLAGTQRLRWRSLAQVIGLAVLAALVNSWFLIFDLLHAKDTMIAAAEFNWDFTKMFDTPAAVLSPLRETPAGSTTSGVVVTTPVLALLLALAIRIRARTLKSDDLGLTRRLWWVALGGVVVLLVLMMMPAGGWDLLPSTLKVIQFPCRLAAYTGLLTAIILILSLRFASGFGDRSRRAVHWTIAALVVLTVYQAGVQLYPKVDGNTGRSRNLAFAGGPQTPPLTFYDPGSYRDHTLPEVPTSDARMVLLPTPLAGVTELTATVALPAGEEPILTNIDAAPWNAKITGAGFKVVGRATDGRLAIARVPGGPDQVTITIKADGRATQTFSGALSVIAFVGLIGLIAAIGVRRRREGVCEGTRPSPLA